MANYDIIGNIAILKFKRGMKAREKKREAERFLEGHKSVRTVLEKIGKFSGRLRTQKTSWLAGEKTKEALYRENGCIFRLNVDTCYFSPRLSSERKEIASYVRKGEKVLVLFGGVAPFAVVIGKLSRAERVVSVEIGRECSKYAQENVRRNKLEGKVEIVQGNVRKVLGEKVSEKFDRIVMARPNSRDSFLDIIFPLIKKAGMIHYYGFYKEEDLERMRELILDEAGEAGRKIKVVKIKKAGEIAVKKFRYRIDFKVQ